MGAGQETLVIDRASLRLPDSGSRFTYFARLDNDRLVGIGTGREEGIYIPEATTFPKNTFRLDDSRPEIFTPSMPSRLTGKTLEFRTGGSEDALKTARTTVGKTTPAMTVSGKSGYKGIISLTSFSVPADHRHGGVRPRE